jgi:hypothetical protein
MSGAQADYIEWCLWAAVAASLYFVGVCTLAVKWWQFRRHPITTSAVAISFGVLAALSPSAAHYVFGFNIAHQAWLGWYTGSSLLAVASIECWRARVVRRLTRRSKNPADDLEDAEVGVGEPDASRTAFPPN